MKQQGAAHNTSAYGNRQKSRCHFESVMRNIRLLLFAVILFGSFSCFRQTALALGSVYRVEITQLSESEAALSWEIYNTEDVDCYVIERCKPEDAKKNQNSGDVSYSADQVPLEKRELVAFVTDPEKKSAKIPVSAGESYVYTVVVGRIDKGDDSFYYTGSDSYKRKDPATGKTYDIITYTRSEGCLFSPTHFTIPIQNVTASEGKITVSWEKAKEAVGYRIFTSDTENGDYVLKKEVGKEASSYTFSAKAGELVSIKLKTVYKGGVSGFSGARVVMLANSSGKASLISQGKMKQEAYRKGQYGLSGRYGGNWSSADKTYYYQEKGHFFVVSYYENKLYIYELDENGKCLSTKKVTPDKGFRFGGFYHGPDHNQYVALGTDNLSEKDSKVVIKVIQYDQNWKKKKTAKIKGGVSNAFKGIYRAFDAANVRMDLKGNQLRLVTGRTMYVHSDGLHHQSNIAFTINTKTMKAAADNLDYTSHSFNQFVRYKDEELYELNHGDAYPRSVKLTVGQLSQKDNTYNAYGAKSYSLFKIKGAIGQNYTGVFVGGMEVGSKSVITVGCAQPHYLKVKKVSGFGNYGYNVYLTVTDRTSGKNKVVWLTKNNPNNTSLAVSEARLVKLSDDYFAVLFSQIKNEKATLVYYVTDQNGKKVYQKKYAGYPFTAATQPILYNGQIRWTESVDNVTRIVSIPAKF